MMYAKISSTSSSRNTLPVTICEMIFPSRDSGSTSVISSSIVVFVENVDVGEALVVASSDSMSRSRSICCAIRAATKAWFRSRMSNSFMRFIFEGSKSSESGLSKLLQVWQTKSYLSFFLFEDGNERKTVELHCKYFVLEISIKFLKLIFC